MKIQTDDEVRQLVDEELKRCGLDPEHADETRELLRWAKTHKETYEKVGTTAWRSVVLVVVTGILVAVWEGAKHLIAKAMQ